MNLVAKIAIVVSSILVTLIIIGWFGFQIPPKRLPAHPETTHNLGTIDLPTDLPEPVYRYFKVVLGDKVPQIETAVIRGRARVRTKLWANLRFKATYVPGRDFYREMDMTWFGLPLIKATDSYLAGEGVMNIAGNISSGEKIDQGQVLALWAEAVFTPSVFVTDPRIRWEAVDDDTARLIVPFGEQEETMLVKFDPQTGLLTQISALRYRGQEENKTPWQVDMIEWQTFHSVMIPAKSSVTWEDEGSPWAYWTIEGVEYNVDVSDKIPSAVILSR